MMPEGWWREHPRSCHALEPGVEMSRCKYLQWKEFHYEVRVDAPDAGCEYCKGKQGRCPMHQGAEDWRLCPNAI